MLGRSHFYLLGLIISSFHLCGSVLSLCAPSIPFPAGRGQPPGVQWPNELLTQLAMLLKPVFFISHTCLPVSLTPAVSIILKTHLPQSQACREGPSSVANVPAGSRPQLVGTWRNWFWSFSFQGQPEFSLPRKQRKWSRISLVADMRTQIQT